MEKSQFLKNVSARTGMTQKDLGVAFAGIFEEIKDLTLEQNDKLQTPIGTFSKTEVAPRSGKTPAREGQEGKEYSSNGGAKIRFSPSANCKIKY